MTLDNKWLNAVLIAGTIAFLLIGQPPLFILADPCSTCEWICCLYVFCFLC